MINKEDLQKRGLIATGRHLPYNRKLRERARDLRRHMTQAERKLWDGYLKHFKHRVLRQRPIDNYIVDFYCPELKLVMEIDGESHFTEEGKVYDNERTDILESYGLKIIRISNEEIKNNFENVCKMIERITT